MRVLLINPSMNLNKLGRFAKLLEPMPCIGLASGMAAIRGHFQPGAAPAIRAVCRDTDWRRGGVG